MALYHIKDKLSNNRELSHYLDDPAVIIISLSAGIWCVNDGVVMLIRLLLINILAHNVVAAISPTLSSRLWNIRASLVVLSGSKSLLMIFFFVV